MLDIIPAILTDDKQELRKLLKKCDGVVDRIQVDIIDGVFADNKTVSPTALYEVKTDLKIDYHLMVNLPERWIDRCVKAHADRVIAQVEMMKDQKRFVKKVKDSGVKVGLAIDIDTHISEIKPELIEQLDVILIMSVPAGFGGQEFNPKAVQKIKALAGIRNINNFKYKICDDGGITLKKVDDAHYMGADEVSIGRRLFEGDLKENIEKFKEAAHEVDMENG